MYNNNNNNIEMCLAKKAYNAGFDKGFDDAYNNIGDIYFHTNHSEYYLKGYEDGYNYAVGMKKEKFYNDNFYNSNISRR